MAEAAVEERTARFFCHVCNVEVQSVGSEFTCPLCSSGFIEELPSLTPNTSTESNSGNDVEMDNLDFLATLSFLASRDAPRHSDAARNLDFLGSVGRGTRPEGSSNSSEPNRLAFEAGSWPRHNRVGNYESNNGVGRRPRRTRLPNFERFDNVLLEILHTLSGSNDGALNNASMFFMGNPGDYAWGREGIDTIVTQLLNQMETTGPPPLPKEKIDEIPKVEVTEEQVNVKLQCSVCWEDFQLKEQVRKLPCQHLYHESCIVPWLELHGTCPICRKSLINEKDTASNSRTTSTDSANSLNENFREDDENGRTFNLSGVPLSFENLGSNSNNSSLGMGPSRRLHISLPRFTFLGQQNPNRTGASTFNDRMDFNTTDANSAQHDSVPSATTGTSSNNQQQVEQNNKSNGDTHNSDNPNTSKRNENNSSSNLEKNKTSSYSNNADANASTSLQGETSAGNNTSNRTQSNSDVFKFEDGQVEFDYD